MKIKSKNNSKRKSRTVISFLFSFLLSLILTLTVAFCIVRIALSEKTLIRVSRDDTYYGHVLQQIVNSAYDYTLPNGIDAEHASAIVSTLFSPEEVKNSVDGVISAAFMGTEAEPDVEALKARAAQKITEYYEESEEDPENLDEIAAAYADDIAELYTNGLKIIGIRYIVQVNETVTKFFPIGMVFCAVLIFLLAGMCVRLHSHVHKGLRYIAYALGGSALTLFIGPFVFYLSKYYTRINVEQQSLYYLLTSLVEYVLQMFFISAAVLFVLMIALIIVIAVKRNQLMHGSRE